MKFKEKAEDVTIDGLGIIKLKDKFLYCYNLLKDEEAIILATKKIKGGYICKVSSRLTTSDDRTPSRCNVFLQCGGCQLLHLKYESQLDLKTRHVKECLRRIGRIDIEVNQTIGMENPYNYRNKVQVPIGKNKQGEIVAGFYADNSHKIIPFSKCLLQDDFTNSLIKYLCKLLQDYQVEPYDEKLNNGVIRHIYIRKGNNGYLLNFIVKEDIEPIINQLIPKLIKDYPLITAIAININPIKTNVILGEQTKLLYGQPYLEKNINDLKFILSSNSFYQVNDIQMEKLYQFVLDNVGINKDDIVLDAYSGIGTIGLFLARKCQKVVAVEINKTATSDGIYNGKINNIDNIVFINDDTTKYLSETKDNFTLVVIDPPRKGCSKVFINKLLEKCPHKIVYISCDPATLARDLSYFIEKYEIKIVQPFDMFPHTRHIECVVIMELSNKE